MSYECYDLVLCRVECRPVWSVSCTRVWSVSYTLVSSRSRVCWLVYRIRVESGCVVSPCWTESYYVSCMYTVWFGRVTCRVVEVRFTNRTDRCRIVLRFDLVVRIGSDWIGDPSRVLESYYDTRSGATRGAVAYSNAYSIYRVNTR
jgi:hypothetical protein